MNDLTTWLLAQLDAEAETARAAAGEQPWTDAGDWDTARVADASGRTVADCHSEADGAHIARQDPQATLNRIDAIRAVVAMHYPGGYQGAPHCTTCAAWTPGDEDEDMRRSPVAWPCPTLRALAYAYRWQPGWESRWAPEGVSADA